MAFSKELIGIPYEYGESSLSGADCWGLVMLRLPELRTRVNRQQYYDMYPSHDKAGLRIILSIAKEAGIERTTVMREGTILIGVGKQMSFGTWCLDEQKLLTTHEYSCSRLMPWSDWHHYFTKVILLNPNVSSATY
jgi:hypothetical protein